MGFMIQTFDASVTTLLTVPCAAAAADLTPIDPNPAAANGQSFSYRRHCLDLVKLDKSGPNM